LNDNKGEYEAMSVRQLVRLSAPLAAFVAVTAPAAAHTGHASLVGFTSGFLHPVTGLDHVLAMVAVGLLSALLGGRALWLVPGSFIAAMLIGGALGWSGAALPLVELAIVASVVVLGIVVATARRMPVAVAMALAAAFAVFHGHAHGTEMPAAVSGLTYALGFLSATALLHAVGLAVGLGTERMAQGAGRIAVRTGGGVIAALGLVLFLA
jgi:urease accessory protein